MKLPALFSFLILGFFIFLSVHSFLETKAREGRLELLRSEVATLQKKAEEKKQELTYRSSTEFVEKEAREKLSYAKPGEVIAVLPDFEAKVKSPETLAKGDEEKSARGPSKNEPSPYWKQWRTLFFGD